MRCFRCSGESSSSRRKNRNNHNGGSREDPSNVHLSILVNTNRETMKSTRNGEPIDGKARSYKYVELEAATQNFKEENFLGEGGFGPVYQGRLEDTGQKVAIKQLNHDGFQGMDEFLIEVYTLCKAEHPNLVELIGFCNEGNQRVLVYEYMPLGSLEDHIFDLLPGTKPLDWNTRMEILAGSARGLEHLHNSMDPPLIYRDLKCSNILLGPGYHPKLSDFGLAKIGPQGDRTHVSTRVMGTYGYCAPEYAATGQLTYKSDIYSFGVVVLEMISGRRAIDTKRAGLEQNLVEWAKPLFKDRKKFKLLVDPLLEGRYPVRGLFQAVSIAALCLQEQAATRPLVSDLVSALNYLVTQRYDPAIHNRNSDHSSAPSRCTTSG